MVEILTLLQFKRLAFTKKFCEGELINLNVESGYDKNDEEACKASKNIT